MLKQVQHDGRWGVTAAAFAFALAACTASEPTPDADPPEESAAPAPAPATDAYLAVLRDPQDVWPMAIVGGIFRVVDGCAMVGDHLLVMPKGSTLAGLRPGVEVEGGGGEFPLASFSGRDSPWAVAEPIPDRCARLAKKGLLTAGLRARPPSRNAPPEAPPAPVADPASCPPGTKLSFGLCRTSDGTVVRVVERR